MELGDMAILLRWLLYVSMHFRVQPRWLLPDTAVFQAQIETILSLPAYNCRCLPNFLGQGLVTQAWILCVFDLKGNGCHGVTGIRFVSFPRGTNGLNTHLCSFQNSKYGTRLAEIVYVSYDTLWMCGGKRIDEGDRMCSTIVHAGHK
jgi:hypothetical protein